MAKESAEFTVADEMPVGVRSGRVHVEDVYDRAVAALRIAGAGKSIALPIDGDGKAQRSKLSRAARLAGVTVRTVITDTHVYAQIKAPK